jgi:hypothetical protein
VATVAERVRVRRRPDPGYPGRPWLAVILDGTALEGITAPRSVGRYPTMGDAVRTGVTAARFLAAGVPWKAEL